MSLITPSVGNASGVAAQVPIEQQLDELSHRHRVALSQARVLDEVAKLAQASATKLDKESKVKNKQNLIIAALNGKEKPKKIIKNNNRR